MMIHIELFGELNLRITSFYHKLKSFCFRHKGSITLPKIRFNITIDFGVSHGDDNFIMFHQAEPVESLKSEEDAKMSKKLVSMWTRFATYGKTEI